MASNKVVLLVIASQGYQPLEYGLTRKTLEHEHITVVTASDKHGTAVASQAPAQAEYKTADIALTIDEVDASNYDGIFLIGGPGALKHLDTEITQELMRNAEHLGKLYGAICISPRILAHAGLLQDKKATGWDGDDKLPKVLQQHNAIYVEQPVVTDGNLITAEGPSAAEAFGHAIAKKLRD